MGRYGRRRSTLPLTGAERSSIGDSHVEEAIAELNRTCAKTAAVMCNFPHSLERTLPMLFNDEALEKLRAVRNMVSTSNVKSYPLFDHCEMGLDFEGASVPSIEPNMIFHQPARMIELHTFKEAVLGIYRQFEEVKAVLKWLNRNATPGAIRYYFPTAMKLCPKAPIWDDLREVPVRYTTPPDVHHWLQPMKDAATTITASLMLPAEAHPKTRRKHGAMWLTFKERRVTLDEDNSHGYTTDRITFQI